ncbi:GerAB/ArcD/ProY family transporter [Paenibacillus lemnae]|uniref:GerAB/ArcD/ProY family transporter n=1 Tax=Paenibacillus lemnae TaxID=1330551 RepID=A0A848M6U8_PAELE|nr:GerAB/ArcD/ProY family transporter [Paenibacillus lemnae]NMO95979.1 GerAB/ArcD/ProY family transporter [Paenibacillus lemnae]
MRQSPWQLFRFAFIYLNSQPTAYLIPPLLAGAGYLGWISIIGAMICSLLLLYCTVRLGMADPETSWLYFGERIVGKWPHTLVLILIVFWIITYVAVDIESFTLFYGSNYMRATPQWVIQIVLGFVIIITARWGIVPLIYMADGLFFLTIFSIVLTLASFSKDAHYDWLPGMITHHNFGSVWKQILFSLSFVGEWIVFLFLAPLIKINRQAFRNLACSVMLITLAVVIEWGLTLLNFGLELARILQYPLVELIRSSITGLLGNSDPIIIGLWATSMFIHSSFLLQIGAHIMAKLLNVHGLEMEKPLITLLGGSASISAYQLGLNPALYQKQFSSFAAVLFWIVIALIPVVYLIILKFKGGLKPKPAGIGSDQASNIKGNTASNHSDRGLPGDYSR